MGTHLHVGDEQQLGELGAAVDQAVPVQQVHSAGSREPGPYWCLAGAGGSLPGPNPHQQAGCAARATLTCLVTSTQTSSMLGCCAEPALAFGDLPLLLPHCPRNRDRVPQHPHPTGSPRSQAAYPLMPRFSPVNQCWLSALVAMPRFARASCHQKAHQCQGATGVLLLQAQRCHRSGLLQDLYSHRVLPAAHPQQHSLLPWTSPASPAASPPPASSPALPAQPGPAPQPFGGRTSATSPAPLRTAAVGTEFEVRQLGWSPAGLEPPVVPGLCKIIPSLRQTLTL